MSMVRFERDPGRILIIKPSAIGDIVHALPVLSLLRRRWPGAKVSWLVTPVCADLLRGQPQIDELIIFERKRFGAGWRSPRALGELLGFLRSLREPRFDLVLDMQGLFRSGWMSLATRSPVRVGFSNAREFGWLFYTHRVHNDLREHAVSRYLDMAEAIGCGREPVEFVLPTDEADRTAVAGMIGESAAGLPYAVLAPGANWATKRWPVENFASLVNPMRQEFGLNCVVAGGPGDRERAAKIPGAIDLTGRTTLRQLVALLAGAAVVVGNDSGPSHIAAALGRPLVTLYGPTSPVATGPWGKMDGVVTFGVPCQPCYSRRCRVRHHGCMRNIGVEAVLAKVREQMGAGRVLPIVAG
jgi:lipopolysaccharide heptosyltransferase I